MYIYIYTYVHVYIYYISVLMSVWLWFFVCVRVCMCVVGSSTGPFCVSRYVFGVSSTRLLDACVCTSQNILRTCTNLISVYVRYMHKYLHSTCVNTTFERLELLHMYCEMASPHIHTFT